MLLLTHTRSSHIPEGHEVLKTFDISRTTYTVSDFLGWQREGRLRLSPAFQRRSVWTPGHKSYLLDTVVRGLPVPVVFIRDSLQIESKAVIREMVDGQQRIRTLLAYVEPSCLPDYDPNRDAFTLTKNHNSELHGRTFDRLPEDIKIRILTYEFSTHVLPLGTEDRDILQIFARMNSTGLKLSSQELRNAEYFGPFKTLMYELATEQLDLWRTWRIFTEDGIARMKEVELVSDLCMSMIEGLRGKTQGRLDKIYDKYNEEFKEQKEVAARFRTVMDTLEKIFGDSLGKTAFRSEVNFFTLFVYTYDAQFGLGSPLTTKRPTALPKDIADKFQALSDRLKTGDVPDTVLDAMQRASADLGRRRTRLEYVRKFCAS